MSDDEDGYKCPMCESDRLKVVSCKLYDDSGNMPLSEDGFELSGSTEDEVVECIDCGYEDDIRKFMPQMKLHGQTADEWADELFEFELCDSCGHDKEMHDIIPFEGNWFARCKVDVSEKDELQWCSFCDNETVYIATLKDGSKTRLCESCHDAFERGRDNLKSGVKTWEEYWGE